MRRRTLLALAAALVASLAGCSGGADPSADHEIVVTTNILGDVVRNVVGDTASVRVLMKPNADPHSFGLSAQDAASITRADLIVYNGLGLEESLQRHVDSAADNGVPTLAVGDHVDPIPYAAGESEGRPDPHFWMDPQRMIAAVDAIEKALRERVSDGAERISANAETYREQLRDLSSWMTDRFGAIPVERRKLVTNHHVLGYLAERFGFTVVGAVVPSGSTLASPSSSDLESLTGAIRGTGVPAIFVDSSHPDRLARVLAEQAGVDIDVVELYSESLDEPGSAGATYLDMMRTNTEAIVTGLTGR
ncbi:MAG TPA: zinc ABC transporter substrate-binding protein AztC [Mycobacterium sp.]|nr:zinc ABC transporter substrate-binding protein AztC [Mycobacterium sp.]